MTLGISGGIALATVAFVFFEEQAERVVSGSADSLDERVLALARARHTPAMDRLMRFATDLGSHPSVGAMALFTAFTMMKRKRRHDAWTVLTSTGGAMVLATALKEVFRRDRPAEENRKIRLPKSHSFPSAHSLMATATFPIVFHHLVGSRSPFVQVTAQVAAGSLILAIGFSRIYFAVHFPSDVFAGFAAGFGWLGLSSLSHTLHDRDLVKRGHVIRHD